MCAQRTQTPGQAVRVDMRRRAHAGRTSCGMQQSQAPVAGRRGARTGGSGFVGHVLRGIAGPQLQHVFSDAGILTDNTVHTLLRRNMVSPPPPGTRKTRSKLMLDGRYLVRTALSARVYSKARSICTAADRRRCVRHSLAASHECGPADWMTNDSPTAAAPDPKQDSPPRLPDAALRHGLRRRSARNLTRNLARGWGTRSVQGRARPIHHSGTLRSAR